MLTSTLMILPCLVLIRLLPLLDPETVVCTWGLNHLSLSSQPPSCSPCFNSTNANSITSGTPCVMVTTVDDYSSVFFLPLFILGLWCLFEETAILCKRCKKWPLPYRWAEVPWTTNRTKRPSQLKQDWDLKTLKQTFVDGGQLEENEVNDREEKYDMKGGKDENKAMEKKLDQAFVDGEQ